MGHPAQKQGCSRKVDLVVQTPNLSGWSGSTESGQGWARLAVAGQGLGIVHGFRQRQGDGWPTQPQRPSPPASVDGEIAGGARKTTAETDLSANPQSQGGDCQAAASESPREK